MAATNVVKFSRRPDAVVLILVPFDPPGIYSMNAHQALHCGPIKLLELINSIERMLIMPADEFTERFVLHDVVQIDYEKLDEIAYESSGDK